ncbi:MAG: hypothetical protein ACXABY_33955 [Candidatus Thorarchaeota archaeon]
MSSENVARVAHNGFDTIFVQFRARPGQAYEYSGNALQFAQLLVASSKTGFLRGLGGLPERLRGVNVI